MRKFVLVNSLFLIALTSISQVIPADRRVNWSNAGYEGTIPDPEKIISLTAFGAIGVSLTDNYNAGRNAIESLEGRRSVVFFP